MAKLIAFVSSFIAAFLVIGMAAYFRYYAPAGTFLHPELDPAALVRELRGLNDLVRVRYRVESEITVEGKLLIVSGRVTAAVDLSAVNQYAVESVHVHEAVIRLAAPQIVAVTVDPQATQVWDARHTAWAAWAAPNPAARQGALTAAEGSVRKSAIDMGILEEARRQARQTVSAFLGALGITQVRFAEE